ncbi:MAG TPA: ABC transporter substrate-binding protein [Chloroflexota bacterium]|nr:ABC transporter substrate-binding protein [Chloroflexota bacterium]
MLASGLAAWGRRPALLIALGVLLACSAPAAAPAAPTAAPAPAPPAAPTAAAPAPTAAAPVAALPLRFAYTALSTTIAPYWIAEDAGYFREEGLDLDTRFISASTVGMQSLLARELDVTTVTGGAALQAAANGGDIAIFATNVNAIISQMITAPDVTAPEQLRGQPLGVVRFGTVSDFVAKLLLRGWGLEPGRDVPLVQLGGQAETIGAMQSGGVRSVVVADLPALELRRLGFRLMADGADLGREYVGLGVVANRPYLNSDGETIRRFVRGLARGMGRFVGDKDYSLQVIQKYTKMEDPEALETSWQAHTQKYANKSLLTTAAAIRTVQEEVADDPRAAGLSPESVIDNRFVQELHDSGFMDQVYR